MNAAQKRAWFIVGVIGLACIAYVVSGLVFGFRGAWGAFGIFGLVGFAPFIIRREKADERDASINRRAALMAGIASYATFIICCTGIWIVEFAWQRQELVSVHMFAQVTLAGWIVCYLAHSVTILVLYGRHVEADNA